MYTILFVSTFLKKRVAMMLKSTVYIVSFLCVWPIFLSAVPANTVVGTINVGVTPAGLAITPDNQYAYVANNNNYVISGEDSVSVINLTTNLVEEIINDASFNQPYTITINPAGTKAYVSNSNSTTVTVIDTATNLVSAVITGFDGPSGMVISPDGTRGYVNNYGGPGGVGSGNGTTVRVVNLDTNAIIGGAITVDLAPAGLAMSSDGAFVYVINYVDGNTGTGTMQIIQTSDNTVLIPAITGFSGPFAIAITPDDQYAYVTNFGSNNFTPFGTTVSVVSLVSNTIIATINLGIQPAGVTISPDGRFAYATNYNALYSSNGVYDGSTLVGTVNILVPGQGTVNIIDTETNEVLSSTISVGQSPANIVITSTGEFAYVSNFISNTVNSIALQTFEIVAEGIQIQNRYLTKTQLVNQLTWAATGTSLPVTYSIYRDAGLTDLVGTVDVTEPFIFLDYNRQPNTIDTYYIVGTNRVGTTSQPVIVTVPQVYEVN